MVFLSVFAFASYLYKSITTINKREKLDTLFSVVIPPSNIRLILWCVISYTKFIIKKIQRNLYFTYSVTI